MKIIAQTPRLIIREFQSDEESLLVNLYLDENVTRHIPGRTVEESKRRFAEAQENYKLNTGLTRWGIFNTADGDFIGVCMLKPADSDPARIELGYVLAEAYWGKGIATDMARELVKYGFEEQGLTEICACANEKNVASHNVLLKAGLKRNGNVFWHENDLPFFSITR